jgi:hypothetical protein
MPSVGERSSEHPRIIMKREKTTTQKPLIFCSVLMNRILSMAILADRSFRWMTEGARFNIKRCLDPVLTTILTI